jgi:hypothetical protein
MWVASKCSMALMCAVQKWAGLEADYAHAPGHQLCVSMWRLDVINALLYLDRSWSGGSVLNMM